MAKTRARYVTEYHLGHGARKVKVQVVIARGGPGFGGAFKACANVSGLLTKKHEVPRKARVCERGNNPRQALGRALKHLGAQIEGRSGAFEGLKRRKR